LTTNSLLLLAADATLCSHFLVVCFVIFGLLLIFIGKLLHWHWVRNPWFRLSHLVTIAIVVFQSWFGIVCPLTILENWFRQQAGETAYSGTFVSHWIGKLLFYEAPLYVFTISYSLFGLLVLISWFWVRPTSFS